MRNYVVCIDGTGNHPDQKDPAYRTPDPATSNVFRVFRMLTERGQAADGAVEPFSQRAQPGHPGADVGKVLYRHGVGSQKWSPTAPLAQYTGLGTNGRILSAYEFLAANHRPDKDRIFAFGFSRGAFAVRSLAGLIQHAGLPAVPRTLSPFELYGVMRSYRNRKPGTPAIRSDFRSAHVDFVGLWDTVGALRLQRKSYHDISPSNVGVVAHALALDELRPQFAPDFWDDSTGRRTGVDETWFTGAHSNIGGGYGQDELSNIALAWVVAKAVEAGLPVPETYATWWFREHAFGQNRDSHKEFLDKLRAVGDWLKGAATPRSVPDRHSIHRSVLDRMNGNVNSEYKYTKSEEKQFEGWKGYRPSARLSDGTACPADWPEHRVSETPDYLDASPRP